MKINGNLDSGALDKLTKPQGGSKATQAKGLEQTAQEGAVAKFSGKFDGINASEAPFDAAKVEQIRQAITEGRFEVNPEAVAEGIIRSAKELLGQR